MSVEPAAAGHLMSCAHASAPPGNGNGSLIPPITPNTSVWALLNALAVMNKTFRCKIEFYFIE